MENPAKLREYLERVTLDLRKARRRIEDLEQQGDEPVAILGMACRYPGGVGSPQELWELMEQGRDGVSEFPTDRGWDLERLYDPDPDHLGTSYTREGGFIEAPASFDPEFFGISPREALAMDPQQRLLLESCWEALEDAGIDPQSLARSATGVFAGASKGEHSEDSSLEGYLATGVSSSVISGRVAYELGLEGPAMTVDTACSSSLVTLHLAAQALRSGECSLALAGGVTVLSGPGPFIEFSRQRGLAPDGRCKSFAEAADGVGWAEGVGTLVLERLSDAERNGHPVLAVIKGSAVNQDGASNGLTAPNGPSQQRVIRQALANARLEPSDIDMVEAHGTGTTLGDPIEAGALLATYGQDRGERGPLQLGAIKSNIGHTQAAAGVAGVIKTVLALREETLPQTLHLDRPSSNVDWSAGEIELLAEPVAWKAGERVRRAGVSSFGISGTNAHVILEEAPACQAKDEEPDPKAPALQGPIPLALSAKSKPALKAAAARLITHLQANPELSPTDLAYSLASTRSLFDQRAVVLGTDTEQLLEALGALAQGGSAPGLLQAQATPGRLAYLFTGQGSQRQGMGKELYESYPAYAKALDQVCAAIDPELGTSLKELVFSEERKDAERLANTAYAQPAIFATELALCALLDSFGLKPELLAGHSIGEIAAAKISGVLSLEDAAKLIVARGALMGALPPGGAMVALQGTEAEVDEAIAGREPELSIAAVNAPTAIVISGAEEAIAEVESSWQKEDKKTKRLDVSHAFHSHLMEPMLADFEKVAKELDYQPPKIPIVSTQSGELLSSEQATDPAYWVAQVREPVRFGAATATLASQGATTLIELGPDAVLSALGPQCLEADSKAAFIATLREGNPETEAITTALAQAHAHGAKLDWQAFFKGTGAKAVPLPTYPFQRQRFWLEGSKAAGDLNAAGLTSAEHPLLSAAAELADDGLLLSGAISLQTHPWLGDHAVAGTVLLPGTAFLECALCAAGHCGAPQVKELTLEAPLILPEQGSVALRVTLSGPNESGEREIAIHSRPQGTEAEQGEWTRHATGTLAQEPTDAPEPLTTWPPEGAQELDLTDFYPRLDDLGFNYGPAFQGLTRAFAKDKDLYAEVSLAPEQSEEAKGYGLHPALADAALHAGLLGALQEEGGELSLRLPFAWGGVSITSPGATASARVALSQAGEELSLTLADQEGTPLATVASLATREVSAEQLRQSSAQANDLFALSWRELARGTDTGADAQTEPPAPELTEPVFEQSGEPAADALAATTATLELIQAHLGAEQGDGEETEAPAVLAIATQGAIATTEEESPDPIAASIWGLVRSAQSEHPGRFALIDSDGSKASEEALPGALQSALAAGEGQLALREGRALVPRAERLLPQEQEGSDGEEARTLSFDPDSTVLITGGTGALGALFATHLVETHGARNLLLVSRSGSEAKGAKELKTELEELGAEVGIAACDVSERDQLKELIEGIDPKHPLGAVIHAAGVLEDTLIEKMQPAQLQSVFAAKVDAAQALHELSAGADLSAFVLFSSIAGTTGGPGQGNYAAANCFLDALAHKRQAEGLPATAIAWGLWQRESTMTAELGDADRARMARAGIEPITDERGTELFERSLASGAPLAVALPLDFTRLRALAAAGTLPALFGSLVRVPARRKGTAVGQLGEKLAGLPAQERPKATLEAVLAEVAAVLGHTTPAAIDPERAFKEMGFDSLAAVELRNGLAAATGLALAPTLVFDYPSPQALATHLLEQATASGATARAAVALKASDEPIAILGMACRYPGGVGSPQELWELIATGGDGVSPFPTDRGWDLERLFDPDPENPGTTYASEGGFIDAPADFDPEFFGISPREALAMDPQQRLLLESCWEALEDAGVDPQSLAGSATGVFAGLMYHDYASKAAIPDELEGYLGSGMAGSVVSGRVAYELGLEGPAMTVDTACSSSLVTLHLAAQALRSGECSLALAGGVTVLSGPGPFIEFSRQRGLAPDGRCKSFAEAADGVGWAEGVGTLVLERLSDAERNGHPVLAVIKGSAVNQDGASNGLTAPNGPSQQRVIRQALANARLEPSDIDMVEAHGTGTTLGDPIEAGALLATYGQDRGERGPLQLGAIKSNIGHTQAAAGVAGVIKTVLALREETLPQTLHLDRPSSNVDWSAGEIELLAEPVAWKAGERVRRAGVSSFGISGTNAHVILEEAPACQAKDEEPDPKAPALQGPIPFALSAKSKPALQEAAARLAAHLRENPELDPTDLAYSLATTRSLFDQRAVVFGSATGELLGGLETIATGQSGPTAISAQATPGTLAFLFTGQGAQRVGMGKELHAASPAFATAFDQACAELDPHLASPLAPIVFGEHPEATRLLGRTEFTQPALFALAVGLFALSKEMGLKPDLLIGHSIGELAAAHLAGVLSLPDAAKLVAARGNLMGELPEGGAMVAIEATEAEATESIQGREAELGLAAINGPTAIVLSGTEEAVAELEAHWQEQERRTKRLDVSHAFHSHLIEPMLEDFHQIAKELDYAEPQIPILSTQSGETLSPEQATDPAYWVAQVREAVRFSPAIETALSQGAQTFLELGPDGVLCAMAASCLPQDSKATAVPLLREGRPEPEALLGALATAHTHGATVDWQAFHKGSAAKRVPLPTYPFQRQRFWLEGSKAAGDLGAAGLTSAEHPLLEAVVSAPEGEGLSLSGAISLQTHPWLGDHAVAGTVLLPGTAFLECALCAAGHCGAPQVKELTLEAPLILPEQGSVALRVTLSGPDESGEREIAIHSRPQGTEAEQGEWTRHATGTLAQEPTDAPEPLTTWPPEGAQELDLTDFYPRLDDLGFNYGPAFQGLTRAFAKDKDLYAEVSLAPEQSDEAKSYGLHPALADAALHAGLLGALQEEGGELSLRLPFAWGGVSITSPGATASARVALSQAGEELSLTLADQEGAPLATVASLATREVSAEQLRQSSAQANDLFALSWRELPAGQAQTETPPPELTEPAFEQSGEPASDALAAATATLELIQAHLGAEQAEGEEAELPAVLAIGTRGAVPATEGESPDPVAASVWGLVRSAQSEHPGRFALVDTDGSEASEEALPGALQSALPAGEGQLALREGRALVPRAERLGAPEQEDDDRALSFDPDSTVLITGGTGGLGALFATHLVETHGARNLLLVSRSGPEAKGAKELKTELEELGAEVGIAACDVSEREQLKELIEGIDPRHPLGAVIHAAGVLEDTLIEKMQPAQLQSVFAAKVDAAQALHELSAGADLSAFVLFSSIAGTTGGPGQGNYAAANCFLDALAHKRQAEGLPATAIAWGLWQRESTMTAELGDADRARMARAGIEPITDERGTELFERSLASGAPLAVALPLDFTRLRALAQAGTLPVLFGSLVRVPARRKGTAVGQLGEKLAGLPAQERPKATLEAVLAEVAAVLGHTTPAAIDPERAFKEMGFDSLAAVELRNGLAAATGLALAPTLVFDYPSPQALATHLLEQATASGATARAAVALKASDEPIAILGMACRYPGGVGSPQELWELIATGGDGVSPFPTDRGWDLERLFDPDPENPGTTYASEGGFIDAPADFDPEFFGISPREALAMDPQQRLLLESCWEALEDAGVDPQSLAGSATGVFAGLMYHDYASKAAIPDELEGYLGSGMAGSVVSGRVAYELGLEGPAMTVDTACSSSLVTLHLAAQALRSGECSLALAGGVTVLSGPGPFIEFSRQRGLAPDGRCKSFAEAADGVGWAEGVGTLVLERLSDAERNGHPVLAVIKGSAVNQDGASNGLTAPNGPSQQRVIRQALANARLEPSDIDMVEAHGTGTTLGDPIEAGALLATYGQDRGERGPLQLGAIKSNIGHTQAAAGVAGVIKTVLALREETLPQTLHLDRPSSNVDWSAGEIELLAEPVAWKAGERVRRAGVSSFGISGTNAHVILEEAPACQAKDEEPDPKAPALQGPIPLALSAKSKPALQEAAARLAAHLRENPELDPTDLAHSLATTRSAFSERAVALGSDREQLLEALGALAQGGSAPNLTQAQATPGRLAYLFTGQGSQRQGMGKELYESYPAYAKALDQVCAAIDPELGTSLKELVFSEERKDAERLANTAYAQPAIFATELALCALLDSFGLKPELLAGHSIGEIAAAKISGVLSLEDAAKLIVARGALMGALPPGGAMVALQGTEAEVDEAIAGREPELSIAAVNAPTAIVISGAEEAIAEVESSWQKEDKKTKRLDVSHAFHSHLMEPMLADFEKVAKELDYQPPKIPIVSTQSGELLRTEQATDPAYWVAQVREPVRFSAATATLADQGATTLIELGPDAVLSALGPQCLEADSRAAFIATLREGTEEPEAIVSALATAHAHGAKLDWQAFFKGTGAKAVPLPTYPFQRQRFWLEGSKAAADASAIGQQATEHPLLGAAAELADDGLLLSGAISLQTHPWLGDHAVAGTVLLPGTAFLECALCAAGHCGAPQVKELTLEAPLILPEQGSVALRVTLSGPDESGEREIAIHSRPQGTEAEQGEWTRHATGTLSSEPTDAPEPLTTWPPEGAEELDLTDLYPRLDDLGFNYGPAFQGLTRAFAKDKDLYAEVSLAPEQSEEAKGYGLHPALTDAALHAGLLGALQEEGGELSLRLPFAWGGVSITSPGATASARVALSQAGEELSLTLADQEGAPLATVASLATREVSAEQLRQSSAQANDLFALSWRELARGTDTGADAQTEPPAPELTEPVFEQSGEPAADALAATTATLELIQAHLGEEQEQGEGEETKAPSVLAIATRNAVPATEGESPDPIAASIWGLVRSAQSEHPGRFALIDSDGSKASEEALPGALQSALPAGEGQLALREGRALVPRAERLGAPEQEGSDGEEARTPSFDPDSTVLITGGTGGLGALFATHLVETHGARNLLLVSRSGPEAKGAKELKTELEELGAEVGIAACDVSEREQLKELIEGIDPRHPLGAVIHAAGVLEDTLIEKMQPAQLQSVFAAKVDAAQALHELSAGADLSAFVLFSSIAGTTGGPGQGNYAAANCFLDALAHKRQAEGLPATAIAWGLWQRESTMTAELGDADRARMARAGIEPITDERGTELFERSLASGAPLAVALPLDFTRLRALAQAGTLPVLFGSLVRVPARRKGTAVGQLGEKLAGLPAQERPKATLEAVLAEVAAVLGHTTPAAIDPERAFKEMGFDSLAAVELRNGLAAATGLALAPTLVFDYPSPQALATHLLEQISSEKNGGPVLESGEREIREALASIPLSRLRRAGLLDALLQLTGPGEEVEPGGEGNSEAIDEMDLESLIRRSEDAAATGERV